MPNSPHRSIRGISLIEAAAGLCILVPVVLALIDISTIVIAQTSNDALAKHAARQAATQTSFALRQQAAQAVVTAYGASSLCSSPQMLSYSEPNSGLAISKQTVKVTTRIVCNLPVPVPMGGPSTQTFQAMDVEPIDAVRTGIIDARPGGTGASGPTDTTYLILSSPLPTGLGGTPIQTAGATQLPGAASPAAPATTIATTSSGGGDGDGDGDGGSDGG